MLKLSSYLFKILSWIIAAAIVVFLAVAAPLVAGYHPVVVLSGSMEPAYPVGSVAYYKSCDFSELKGGDAITFEAGSDGLVTHRIARIDELTQTVVTKGDANDTEDPNPVESSEIKGKTGNIRIPYVGFFVQRAKDPPILIIAALILVIDYLMGYLYQKKKDEDCEG